MSPAMPRQPQSPRRPAAEASEKLAGHSIRVSVDTLDRLMTTVSELVLTRNQLLEIVRRYEDSDFKVPLQRLSNVTAELQEGVMKTRMQPIGNAWQKLPRIVRDLCAELGKEIELEMHGADTELDRQVLELVRDPLTHLVRNCADHGIESPAARVAAGKPRTGTIRLTACHQGGHIIIEIADDGRGLDAARIRAKAIETGLASEAELAGKSDAEISNFIFAPGFSTAAQVTSISGRGVGMDVVRSNIEQIGGTVELKSAAGAGTSFTIKIPLTLAIVSALIVEAAGERFAIPQLSVLELVRAGGAGEHRIERIKDTPVLRLRNQLLPLLYLKDVFRLGERDGDGGFVVVDPGRQSGVRRRRRRRVAHRGDRDQADVVEVAAHRRVFRDHHPGRRLGHHDRRSQRRGSGAGPRRPDRPEPIRRSLIKARLAAADDIVSLLVFRAGSHGLKAVPLSLVTRLEEIDCRRIEISDGRHLVQYRDQLMPLVAHRRRGRPEERRRPADPGILRSGPLDGSRGR